MSAHQIKKILIIQTAFIGDVILATSLIEATKKKYPEAKVDFLLKQGNESLLQNNPHIDKTYIFNKKNSWNFLSLWFEIRREKYDLVLCIQRFFRAGFLCAFSGAKIKVGFDKNPMSLFFTHQIEHHIPHRTASGFLHEVQRNYQLLASIDKEPMLPVHKLKLKLYFSGDDQKKIEALNLTNYFVLAPASVWYTKQWHHSKWKELIEILRKEGTVVLIGGPTDRDFIETLYSSEPEIVDLCGKLNLRESALLMRNAMRVFVNDSAPLHLASSVNAKTTAIFCSTVADFGYFPISSDSIVIQRDRLDCMPCGLHGKKSCPKVHFRCALDIDAQDAAKTIHS